MDISPMFIVANVFRGMKLITTWCLSANVRRFKRFINFHWRDGRKIKIFIAETYAAVPNHDGTSCSGIRATGDGQVCALFYILPWLGISGLIVARYQACFPQ